jgi:hypothetical protein
VLIFSPPTSKSQEEYLSDTQSSRKANACTLVASFCPELSDSHLFGSVGDLIQNGLRPGWCGHCESSNGFLNRTRKSPCQVMDGNLVNSLLSERANGLNYDSSLRSRANHLGRSNMLEFLTLLFSIPTAPTINRVDSVALALSSADSWPQKAGVLVQSWSKASRPNKERGRLLANRPFSLQNHCNAPPNCTFFREAVPDWASTYPPAQEARKRNSTGKRLAG